MRRGRLFASPSSLLFPLRFIDLHNNQSPFLLLSPPLNTITSLPPYSFYLQAVPTLSEPFCLLTLLNRCSQFILLQVKNSIFTLYEKNCSTQANTPKYHNFTPTLLLLPSSSTNACRAILPTHPPEQVQLINSTPSEELYLHALREEWWTQATSLRALESGKLEPPN